MTESQTNLSCSITLDDTTRLPKIEKKFNLEKNFGDIYINIRHRYIQTSGQQNFLFTGKSVDQFDALGEIFAGESEASMATIVEISQGDKMIAHIASKKDVIYIATKGSERELQDILLHFDVVDKIDNQLIEGWKTLTRFCKQFKINPFITEGSYMFKSIEAHEVVEDGSTRQSSAFMPIMYVFSQEKRQIQSYVPWKYYGNKLYPGSYRRFLDTDYVWKERKHRRLASYGNYKIVPVKDGFVQDKTRLKTGYDFMSALINEIYNFNLVHQAEDIRGYVRCRIKSKIPTSNHYRSQNVKYSYSLLSCEIPEGHMKYLDSLLEVMQGATGRLIRSYLTDVPLTY